MCSIRHKREMVCSYCEYVEGITTVSVDQEACSDQRITLMGLSLCFRGGKELVDQTKAANNYYGYHK